MCYVAMPRRCFLWHVCSVSTRRGRLRCPIFSNPTPKRQPASDRRNYSHPSPNGLSGAALYSRRWLGTSSLPCSTIRPRQPSVSTGTRSFCRVLGAKAPANVLSQRLQRPYFVGSNIFATIVVLGVGPKRREVSWRLTGTVSPVSPSVRPSTHPFTKVSVRNCVEAQREQQRC